VAFGNLAKSIDRGVRGWGIGHVTTCVPSDEFLCIKRIPTPSHSLCDVTTGTLVMRKTLQKILQASKGENFEGLHYINGVLGSRRNSLEITKRK